MATHIGFCRVCAKEECEQLLSIFEHPGVELSLQAKIEKHLPIKVMVTDNLPHHICEPCVYKLNICHELVETAKAADLKLQSIFGTISCILPDLEEEQICNNTIVEYDIVKDESYDVHDNITATNKLLNLTEGHTLPSSEVTSVDKLPQNVQFEVVVSDNIEVLKTINESDQHVELLSSRDTPHINFVVETTDCNLFEIKSENNNNNDNGELDNVINSNDQHYTINITLPAVIADEKSAIPGIAVVDGTSNENELVEHTFSNNNVSLRKNQVTENQIDKKNRKNKIFTCTICNKNFMSAPGLDVHKSTHVSDTPYLCDLCGKKFKHINSLHCHKRTHLDDAAKKKHPCSVCSKSFRSKFHLSEHMNIHNGVKPYKCDNCCKTFHKRIQLRQHSSTHVSEENKAQCSLCGLRFTRRSNLQVHIKKCHDENRTYKCRLCSVEVSTLNQLLSHRRKHNQQHDRDLMSSPAGYPCNVCGKALAKKKSLELHLQIHLGENKCWCNICGKLLSSGSLKYHMKSVHCNERKWHCQFCGKGYMSRELQQIHERTHTGVRPYTCSKCNKSFTSSNSLNQHAHKHSETRFECEYCSKKFQRKTALSVHVKLHTGDKRYSCELCERRFVQKNDLLKHQKTYKHKKTQLNTSVCEVQLDEQNSVTQYILGQSSLHEQIIENVCEICGISFDGNNELEKHKFISHGISLPVVFSTSESNNSIVTTISEIIVEDDQNIHLLSNVQP